jgi:uncharacterized integral membrane protein
MSNFDLLPDEQQPSTTEHVRRFGPPLVIGIIALLFVVQNTEETQFNVLWFDFRLPLWIMLVLFMVAGAIIAYGITRRIKSRKARKEKRAEKED